MIYLSNYSVEGDVTGGIIFDGPLFCLNNTLGDGFN